jgi:hypothetical protein
MPSVYPENPREAKEIEDAKYEERQERLRIFRTRFAIIEIPVFLYLSFRFLVPRKCICESDQLTYILLLCFLLGFILLMLLMAYGVTQASLEIMSKGGSVFSVSDGSKAWSFTKKAHLWKWAGISVGICLCIELFNWICEWLAS